MSGQLAQAETAARNVENGIVDTITAWKNGSISAEAAMASLEKTMLPDAESHTLSNGIRQASSALGGSTTNSGNTTIALAAQNLEEGLAQAETKLGNAETPSTLIYGAHAIVSGIRSVGDAAGKAQAGGIAIAKGASNAQAATDALGNGAAQLDDGIGRLQEGLSDGYEALDESLSTTPEEYGAYAVAPVEIENEVFGELGAFGYGFVPLFLTLCLWLGSLALFFVFDPFPSKNVRCTGRFAAALSSACSSQRGGSDHRSDSLRSARHHKRRIHPLPCLHRVLILLHPSNAEPFRHSRKSVCCHLLDSANGMLFRHLSCRSWRRGNGGRVGISSLHLRRRRYSRMHERHEPGHRAFGCRRVAVVRTGLCRPLHHSLPHCIETEEEARRRNH